MDIYIAQIVMTFSILAVMTGFLAWGLKTRQFHNIEDPKYRIIENRQKYSEEMKDDSR